MFRSAKWKFLSIFLALSLLMIAPTVVWSAPGDTTTSLVYQMAEQNIPMSGAINGILDTSFGGMGDVLGISDFFSSIWEAIKKLIHDLATLLAAGLLYVCMNPMLPIDTGNIPAGMDQTVVAIIRTANMVRDLATDLSLLLLLLAIWRFWTIGSWKGQPGSWMSAVGRFIFAIGLVLAWPIIFNFQIHVTNEMLLRSFFQTPQDMELLVSTIDQALQFTMIGISGALMSALAPVFGAITGSALGGPVGTIAGAALGGITGAVGVILFMIFGLVFITEVIYFLVLKAIQIALLTAQYVFAPLFLICFISPDTEHVGSAFIRSFIEVSLWSFVWLGLLKVLCIICAAPGTAAQVLLIIGVLQIMIQVPAFLGRAQISPISEFVTAGAFTGMITQGFSQAGNSIKNAAVNYAKRETSGKFASYGTPETISQSLNVKPFERDQLDRLNQMMNASTSTQAPPPRNGNTSPPQASAPFTATQSGNDKQTTAKGSGASTGTATGAPAGVGGGTTGNTGDSKTLKTSEQTNVEDGNASPPSKKGQGEPSTETDAGSSPGTAAGSGETLADKTRQAKPLATGRNDRGADGKRHRRPATNPGVIRKSIAQRPIGKSLANQPRKPVQLDDDSDTAPQLIPADDEQAIPPIPFDGSSVGGTPYDDDSEGFGDDGDGPGFNGLNDPGTSGSSTIPQKDKGIKRMRAPNYVNAWMRPFIQAINNGAVLIVEGKENGVVMNPDDGTVIITHTKDATDDQVGQLMAIGATAYAQGRTPQGRDRAREAASKKNLDGPQNLKEHILNGILYANTGQMFNETKLGISRGRRGMQSELALGAANYIGVEKSGENNEVAQHLRDTFGPYNEDRQTATIAQMLDEDSTESGANRATGMATQALDGHGEQINDLSRAVMAKSIVATQRIDQKPMLQGVIDYLEASANELGYPPGTYSNEVAQPMVNNLSTEEAYAAQAVASQSGRAACQNLPMVRAVAGLGRKHEPASFREAYREMTALTNDLGGASPRNVAIAAETLRSAQDSGLNILKIANPTVAGLEAGIRMAEQGDYAPQTITATDMRVAQVIPEHVSLTRDNVDLVRQDPEFRNDPDHLPKHLSVLFQMPPDQWTEDNRDHLAEMRHNHELTPINQQTMRTLTHMTPNAHDVGDLDGVALNAARAIMSIERRPPEPALLNDVVSRAESYAKTHSGPVPLNQVQGWVDEYRAKNGNPAMPDFGQQSKPLITFK